MCKILFVRLKSLHKLNANDYSRFVPNTSTSNVTNKDNLFQHNDSGDGCEIQNIQFDYYVSDEAEVEVPDNCHFYSDSTSTSDFELNFYENEVNSEISNTKTNSSASSKNAKEFLSFWSLKNSISHNALTELLHWFHTMPDLSNFSKDARTLLNTPRKSCIDEMVDGEFFYFGLKNELYKFF